MQITIYHIDAFTNNLFAGNPAAVCILEEWLTDTEMRIIAMENYLPATAFLVRKNNEFHVRWFAPEYEIELCGHGSLASAYVIFNILEPTWQQAELHYPAGLLKIKNENGLLTLDFPAKNYGILPSPDLLIKGLGAQPIEVYQYKTERCLAIFETEDEVRNLNPDIQLLKELDHPGIIVTAPGINYDFISRTFYPRKSVYEDAVTGASHCLLIPYWSNHLNKTKLLAHQASKRGGELLCEYQGERVLISGKAIMYMQGIINYTI
ncbi:MAG: PhzF family phenazine biosynthesis protein [Gammaproteobacteria bacterium]|nr:PhzF family phenazine biosynthesis protein [Gammaproteobacteria bacterium]